MQAFPEYNSGAPVLYKPASSLSVEHPVLFKQKFSSGTTNLHQFIHHGSLGKLVETSQCDRSTRVCSSFKKKLKGTIFKQFMYTEK
jgi:hypothetical protein